MDTHTVVVLPIVSLQQLCHEDNAERISVGHVHPVRHG